MRLLDTDRTVYSYQTVFTQVMNLRATDTGRTTVSLEWDAVDRATSYTVEWRAGSSGDYSTATADGTTHTVTGLMANTAYRFRVKASATGPYSDVLGLTTPPPVCGAADVTDLGSLALDSTTTRTVSQAARDCQGLRDNNGMLFASFYSCRPSPWTSSPRPAR